MNLFDKAEIAMVIYVVKSGHEKRLKYREQYCSSQKSSNKVSIWEHLCQLCQTTVYARFRMTFVTLMSWANAVVKRFS